jgi:PAS domain S-box-containing protein
MMGLLGRLRVKTGLDGYRIAILAGFGLLILLLVLMVPNLLQHLHALSSAEDDNTQWSISQLDTEFANLNAALADQLAASTPTDDEIQLRIDIAISRLEIINSGRAARLFGSTPAAQTFIAPLNTFSEQAAYLSDKPGPLTRTDLVELRRLTQEARPNVRKISLLGVRLSAESSETKRAEFAQYLLNTGGIAVGLLILIAALMALLFRMLNRAVKRDAELLESSKQLASTVAAALDAIITADEHGRIVSFNSAAEEIFGWTRDEIIGQKLEATIVPPRMRAAHNAGMERFLKTRIPTIVGGGRTELTALRKSGEEFPAELNITSVKGPKGTNFIAYLRDISDRKMSEKNLIDAKDRAERTDKAKSQFLAVMSHEMRTPLSGILGVLDLLRTTEQSKNQERYTKIATASGEILLEHINEALDITRIETGALKLTIQPFNLPELVTSIADMLEPLAQEKHLGFTYEVSNQLRRDFLGDSGRIRQILTNLVGNAIKFTESGHISIAVHGVHDHDETSLEFAVTDTGAGIAPDHQEHVFEDFIALSHSDGRQSRGDGLGLSISRKIAGHMGGDISLVSTPGLGSTFTLTVPLRRVEMRKNIRTDPLVHTSQAIRARKILIVEDSVFNRRILHDMLSGLGHDIVEAANGQAGVDRANEAKFDLIFMDISMPVLNGIAATSQLRQGNGPNAKTPIIGLTAHGYDEYKARAEHAGMSRFHTKPIRLSALRNLMSELFPMTPHGENTAGEKDALSELCAALGQKKMKDVGTSFFSEFEAFSEDVLHRKHLPNTEETAEAVHKLKGAAAMLGMEDLEKGLAKLDLDTRAGLASNLVARVENLSPALLRSKAFFERTLAQFSG